ncbi:transcriptional regulator FtrA [Klebsiella oxytoca]|uniref:Transcriptional regulator FtrA n=1 Tax=Klebsiella oxytoca TaxID=571 RepID=A0AAI9DYM6_KLEOX|nr:transcriptional regulator FtrA [Klebsiella oxytoca]ELM5278490.1 transcriptional regulator FtrA [Klebsiella oxytoca]MBZ7281507.1 transcriptional regulator FtrA [Klebsiella oxytoca]MBZ7711926.1 transcriptional regulator FtrA [Klebsiella oxytoca]MBZ7714303.1 transcriptional regulator FtrA [Klebsiella oxytoca]MCW9652804.1 transcriptional regulator FtrA [Klebsiella oxytoca]
MTENAEIMTTPSVTLSRHRVVALAYDGLCTFEFGVAVEIFGLPRPEMGERWYRFAVAAVDEGELRATGGIRLMTDGGMSLLSEADTIVVPGWRSIDSPVPPDLCQALVAAHARGCRIISICSGVFVLAAAGLLNGRQATTHWRYTDQLRARFPLIEVIDDVLYVGAEGVMTSAGSAAGIDLCLHLVREDFGIDAANIVARRLVVSPHRDGGQAQQIVRPVAKARESQRLGLLFDFLHQNLAANHTVASLAERAGMGSRTFLRRFEDATGKTPARWLLDERLLRATQHLTHSRLSVEQIAELCGFANASTLRHHFRQQYALSPLQYRKKMQSETNRA